SRIAVVKRSALPTRWIVARLPPGAVPGVSETYTMLSAAAGDAGERDTATLPAIAAAPTEIGFETSRPVGGGGGGGGGGGPTLSVHAANNATQANAVIRRATVPSARTATPLPDHQYATDTM